MECFKKRDIESGENDNQRNWIFLDMKVPWLLKLRLNFLLVNTISSELKTNFLYKTITYMIKFFFCKRVDNEMGIVQMLSILFHWTCKDWQDSTLSMTWKFHVNLKELTPSRKIGQK